VTVTAHLKDAVDALVGDRVYRDEAPEFPDGGPTLPFITIQPDLSRSAGLSGDGRTVATSELFQVDLWQAQDAEDDNLIGAVIDALDSVQLPAPHVRARVNSTVRLVEPGGIIHYAVTVRTVSIA